MGVEMSTHIPTFSALSLMKFYVCVQHGSFSRTPEDPHAHSQAGTPPQEGSCCISSRLCLTWAAKDRVPLASLSSRVLHSANRTEPQAGSCEDKNLLCPAPSSPEDPLLFTVQNLQVFAFGITLRFYHRAREGNHSVVTRRGRPLLASQGPSSVFLSPSWFLAGEGEERRTFSALGSSWFSSSLATCPWAGGPPQLSFPIFGAWCRGTTA
ncbi:uncharacterized protein LOC122236933 [Panthera tigris]|uniref:uncharacterized protein LOC122236933 n=1 Tax=Panthera tigris TaxID=9694 RepID=UPI001C6F6A19|nr:uncharacterized protein LOC122236933 [Panthera tigris]